MFYRLWTLTLLIVTILIFPLVVSSPRHQSDSLLSQQTDIKQEIIKKIRTLFSTDRANLTNVKLFSKSWTLMSSILAKDMSIKTIEQTAFHILMIQYALNTQNVFDVIDQEQLVVKAENIVKHGWVFRDSQVQKIQEESYKKQESWRMMSAVVDAEMKYRNIQVAYLEYLRQRSQQIQANRVKMSKTKKSDIKIIENVRRNINGIQKAVTLLHQQIIAKNSFVLYLSNKYAELHDRIDKKEGSTYTIREKPKQKEQLRRLQKQKRQERNTMQANQRMKKILIQMSNQPRIIVDSEQFWWVWQDLQWRCCLLEAINMLFGPIVNLYEDFMPKVFETKTLLNKKRQKQAVVGLQEIRQRRRETDEYNDTD